MIDLPIEVNSYLLTFKRNPDRGTSRLLLETVNEFLFGLQEPCRVPPVSPVRAKVRNSWKLFCDHKSGSEYIVISPTWIV